MATLVYLKPKLSVITVNGRASARPHDNVYTLTVETGAGVTGSNSYGTVDEARRYFVGRRLFSSAWTTATRETQTIALKQASAALDAEFTWSGTAAVSETQGMAWPFTDATDKYGRTVTGLPKAVKEATFELAMFLLAQDRFVAREGVGLKSLKVDVISLVFDKSDGPLTFPAHVSRMLSGLGEPVRGGNTIRNVKIYRV